MSLWGRPTLVCAVDLKNKDICSAPKIDICLRRSGTSCDPGPHSRVPLGVGEALRPRVLRSAPGRGGAVPLLSAVASARTCGLGPSDLLPHPVPLSISLRERSPASSRSGSWNRMKGFLSVRRGWVHTELPLTGRPPNRFRTCRGGAQPGAQPSTAVSTRSRRAFVLTSRFWQGVWPFA